MADPTAGLPRVLNGGCLCGAGAYTVADSFEHAMNCHCSMCRRATGAACKPIAGIRRDRLRLVEGRDSVSVLGDAAAHDVRCAICGSTLYSVVREGAWVQVAMGGLADEPTIRPSMHIFAGSKAGWHEITDDLPRFESLPND